MTLVAAPPQLRSTVESMEAASRFSLRRLGREEVATLFGFLLMAISTFLPWGEGLGILNVSFTGIQYGAPGILLLLLSVLWAIVVLFSSYWTGYICVFAGFLAMLESVAAMGELERRIAGIATTPYFSLRVGSGVSLAIISSLFVMVGGIALILKRRQSERTMKAAEAATMRLTSPPSIVTGKPETPRSARVGEFDVWILILWLVIILLFSSERAQGWIGGLLMVFLVV